jgi:hypothetical protein
MRLALVQELQRLMHVAACCNLMFLALVQEYRKLTQAKDEHEAFLFKAVGAATEIQVLARYGRSCSIW